MSTVRTTIMISVVLATAALSAAGCSEHRPPKATSVTYGITDPLHRLDVTSRGGDIALATSTNGTVSVTERLHYSGSRPATTHAVVNGVLTLANTGCGHDSSTCDVAYQVAVPAGLDVHLDSDGGTVRLRGTPDSLSVTSGGGTVTGDALTAPAVDVNSGGGTTSLAFTSPPSTLDVASHGGDATLHLPAGPYALTAAAGGGSTHTDLATDPTAARTVHVSTGGGTLTIGG